MARRTLLITYIAIYLLAVGAVTRYLIGFRGHRFWSIAFLLGGYLLVLVSEPLLSRRNRLVTYVYLLVQTAIICALSRIAPNVDFWAMLFCPPVVQVMHNFPQRTGFLMTGVLTVIMSVFMLSGLGPQVGLPLIFVYGVVYFLLAAFIAIIREAEAARDESQKLLGELQEAHQELQAYAEQAEELAAATERKRSQEALQQYADRLRALAARLADVAEVERQRLARELHDRVGQNLTALGINLNIIRSQMARERPEPVHTRLDDSLLLVEQTAERIRDVMADLRPPVLDDYGLVAALHWYGGRLTQRTGITVRVEGEELLPRPRARVENALFRIAQEALTNVTKHAQATNVTVTVELDAGILRLIIADDGVGFDPAQPSEPDGEQGWGLLHMIERAEGVNGRCRIESQPGHGTRVIVEVAQ